MIYATYISHKINTNGWITSIVIKEDNTGLEMEVPSNQVIKAIKDKKIKIKYIKLSEWDEIIINKKTSSKSGKEAKVKKLRNEIERLEQRCNEVQHNEKRLELRDKIIVKRRELLELMNIETSYVNNIWSIPYKSYSNRNINKL